MNAISLHEPYASLIRAGTKTIETRTWRLPWRLAGTPVLICVTKRSGGPFAGMAIAVVRFGISREMEAGDAKEACCDWYLCAKAWPIMSCRRIRPFPVKGRRRIFQVDVHEEDLVYED